MRWGVFVLALLVLLVVPASAYSLPFRFVDPEDPGEALREQTVSECTTNITYNSAENGEIISAVLIELEVNESVNYTMYYGSTSVEGYIVYDRDLVRSTIQWEIGDQSEVFYEDYPWGFIPGDKKQFLLSYGCDSADRGNCTGLFMGRNYAGTGLGWTTDSLIYPVLNVLNTPIYSVSVSGGDPFEIGIYTIPVGTYERSVSLSVYDEEDRQTLIDQVWGFASTSFVIVWEFVYWFKFVFIDNLGLTFALIESIILFRSSQKAYRRRDPLKFFEEFFKQNKIVVDSILGFIRAVIEIAWRIIDALKPV